MGIEPMLGQHLWHMRYKLIGASNYTNLPFKIGSRGGTRILTPLLATDFLTTITFVTRFVSQRIYRSVQSFRDLLFSICLQSGLYLNHCLRFRFLPSSLYTFIFRCLARYQEFKPFTDFDKLHLKGFPIKAQISSSPLCLPFHHSTIKFYSIKNLF